MRIFSSLQIQVLFTLMVLLGWSHRLVLADQRRFDGPLIFASSSDVLLGVAEHKYERFHLEANTILEKNGKTFDSKELSRFAVGDLVEVIAEPYGGFPQAARIMFVKDPSPEQRQASVVAAPASRSTNLLSFSTPRVAQNSLASQSLFGMALPALIGDSSAARAQFTGMDGLLEDVKARANQILESRPNYLVRQVSSRFHSLEVPTKWIPSDVLESEIVFQDKMERHTQVLINGRAVPVDYEAAPGSKVSGEVAGFLQGLFASRAQARFSLQGNTKLNGKAVSLYTFATAPVASLSAGFIEVDTTDQGRIWIDNMKKEIVQIEETKIPVIDDFPILKMERRIDFDDIMIGGQSIWLPVSSDLVFWGHHPRPDSLVRTTFSNYRKFEAESKIAFQ